MKEESEFPHPIPPLSYSNILDKRVSMQERPYGYTTEPPPADTGDYNMRAYETTVQRRPRR